MAHLNRSYIFLILFHLISGPYEQIFDVLQGYLSELPDDHTLDIETSVPYEQICDGL